MSKEEMLIRAIESHISMLYRDAECYKRNGNKEAMIDCYNEAKKYQALKDTTNGGASSHQ